MQSYTPTEVNRIHLEPIEPDFYTGDENTITTMMDADAEVKAEQGYEVHQRVKIGRNEPCPCGSGKKFKKCHLGRAKVAK